MGSKKSNGESYGAGRVRNFVTIVYPESAPENWLNVLSEMLVPAMVSPLHENDVNADGEKKKAHYHVVFCFDSVKTIEQARECTEAIGGVGCEIVKSMRAQARYLCHLDNPDKAQYSPDLVQTFGGIDYNAVIMCGSDRRQMLKEMMIFCKQNQVCSFSEFCLFCAENNEEWFYALTEHSTYVMGEFIRSQNYDLRNAPLGGGFGLPAAPQLRGEEDFL